MTAEEFCRWWDEQPDEDCRFELHDGRPVRFGLAGQSHGFVCANFGSVLWEYANARGGFTSTNYPLLLLGRDPDTVVGPDVLFFTAQLNPAELNGMFWDRVPTVAIEVLNFDDTESAVRWRVNKMLRRGIPHVWVADPEDHTATAYTPDGPPRALRESDLVPLLDVPARRIFRFPGSE